MRSLLWTQNCKRRNFRHLQTTTEFDGDRIKEGIEVPNTGGNAVGGIGAILVPVTAKYFGWVAAVSTGSVFALVGAILWLFIRADIPLQPEHE